MKNQKSWPFLLLIASLCIGLPSLDHYLKAQAQKKAIEIPVTIQDIPVASV